MTKDGKRESQGAVGRHHLSDRIEEEHHSLREQLDAVAAATTCTALLQSLLPLSEMLQAHFALEEQSDGFYDDLEAHSPSMASELSALRDEHRVMLDEWALLSRQLKERMDAERRVEAIGEDMKKSVERSLDRLRRHEHRESVMIGDAYYTDEGGRG
jgi:hypothetical protein